MSSAADRESESHSNGLLPSAADSVPNGSTTEASDGRDEEFEDLPGLDDVNEDANKNNGAETKSGDSKPRRTRGFNLGDKKKEVIDDDGWLDVLENGQLKKKVLRPGDTSSARPERTCKVTINLKTKSQSNQEVIQSETGDGLVGIVGDYDFMHGVDMVIPLMHIGEVSVVEIASRFAYGEMGKKPDIEPDAAVVCEVELLECDWIDSELELPLEEKLKFGKQL